MAQANFSTQNRTNSFLTIQPYF